MLLLVFRVQRARYALDARQVVEVLPLVHLHPSPHAPPGVAGVFNYHGSPVAAIDVSHLLGGRPADARLSTRVAVVRYPVNADQAFTLGLVVEHAIDTVRRPHEDFVWSGVSNDATPYLGPVAPDPDGMIQLIELNALLPVSVRDVLFTRSGETS